MHSYTFHGISLSSPCCSMLKYTQNKMEITNLVLKIYPQVNLLLIYNQSEKDQSLTPSLKNCSAPLKGKCLWVLPPLSTVRRRRFDSASENRVQKVLLFLIDSILTQFWVIVNWIAWIWVDCEFAQGWNCIINFLGGLAFLNFPRGRDSTGAC